VGSAANKVGDAVLFILHVPTTITANVAAVAVAAAAAQIRMGAKRRDVRLRPLVAVCARRPMEELCAALAVACIQQFALILVAPGNIWKYGTTLGKDKTDVTDTSFPISASSFHGMNSTMTLRAWRR
jgi:hypothetical protein